jgi:spore coat polysaccharide biosynthesis protein SpsF
MPTSWPWQERRDEPPVQMFLGSKFTMTESLANGHLDESNQGTLAIVQARMSSSRLPGKVLLDIGGQPLLWWVVSRARQARRVQEVLVATTLDPSDEAVAAFCAERQIRCFRGQVHDVLDRYYQAARFLGARLIVRLTADCPLVDPQLIDETIQVMSIQAPDLAGLDFAATRLPPPWSRSYPIGLDIEVCTFAGLERAWREADQPFQREHVMPFFYEEVAFAPLSRGPGGSLLALGTTPRDFRIAQLHHAPDLGQLRWTVDTPADLEFLRQIAAHFPGRMDFTWREVLALLEAHPALADINAAVAHKTAFDFDARGYTGLRD